MIVSDDDDDDDDYHGDHDYVLNGQDNCSPGTTQCTPQAREAWRGLYTNRLISSRTFQEPARFARIVKINVVLQIFFFPCFKMLDFGI